MNRLLHPISAAWTAAIAAAPVRIWALILGPQALTIFAAWVVSLVADPGRDLSPQRIGVLAWTIYILLALVSLFTVAITGTRFRGVGFGGASLDVGGAAAADSQETRP